MKFVRAQHLNTLDDRITAIRRHVKTLRIELMNIIREREKHLRQYVIENQGAGHDAIKAIKWNCFETFHQFSKPICGSDIADCVFEATLIATLLNETFYWEFNDQTKTSKPLEF